MLTNLHVKNLALIEETDINFENGLNILTGETGAGKSVILGSVNIALGGRVTADIIRKGAEYALTELVFHIEDAQKLEMLRRMDIEELSEGDIIISRKITAGRSQIKVNGMNCTVGQVRQIAALLIDIHGQHDSQMLLQESRHLEMVDLYGGEAVASAKEKFKDAYRQYSALKEQLASLDMDEETRQREISFIEFEVNEITSAGLQSGEDEQLEMQFRRMSNAQKIMEEIAAADHLLNSGEENVRDLLGMAVRSVLAAAAYDEALEPLSELLNNAEELLSDAGRRLSDYAKDAAFDEADFAAVQARLDFVNALKMKYGRTIEDILAYGEQRQQKLTELYDYDTRLQHLNQDIKVQEEKLDKLAEKLTDLRKKAAKKLCKQISDGLKALNFLNTEFTAAFEKADRYTANGNDIMRFMISTNIGEALKPLSKVASGGELSRIMLAVKTAIAGQDDIETLIFDEIDAGISGRTAQMVAEKLKQLARGHQIICITHLPQIAAMADMHYLIEKSVENDSTITDIKALSEEESVYELARLLGGSSITDTVISNARELKQFAQKPK